MTDQANDGVEFDTDDEELEEVEQVPTDVDQDDDLATDEDEQWPYDPDTEGVPDEEEPSE